MSEMQRNIFEAVSLIAKKEAARLGYDRTIKGVITKIDNSICRISYQGNIITAYNDYKLELAVGDEVYVKVPGDNFSNRKIIEGKAEDTELDKTNLIGVKVTPISIDFTTDNDKIGVIAGKGDSALVPIGNAEYFKAYAAIHKKIQISADFETIGLENVESGTYGLKVVCGTVNGDTVEFTFDTKDFIGRPWEYSTPAPQSIIFEVDNPGYLTSLESVTLFQEGINKTPGTSKDILVSNVKVQFVEETEVNKKNYVLTIVPSNGTILFDGEGKNETTLKAQLWYMGQNIISQAKLRWFIQDSSITSASEGYVKEAGGGWREMEGQTETSLSVTPSVMGAPARTRAFKVLAAIDSADLIVDSKVTIYYQQDLTTISVIPIEGANNKITGLKINDGNLVGFWYLDFNTAIQKELTNGKKSNSIEISEYIKDLKPGQQLVFVCEAYDNKGYFKGYGSYVYTEDIPLKPTVITEFIGDEIFHYDANGDISFLKYDKTYSLHIVPRLQDKLEAIEPEDSFTWVIGDKSTNDEDVTITNINQTIEGSMVDTIRAENNTIYFTVKPKYNYYKDNNTLKVSFKYEGNEYVFTKDLSFVKDGDQGTNGTSYILVVRPVDKSYTTFSSQIKVKATLYRDGELYNDNPSVSWMPDPHNGMQIVSGDGTAQAIIQVPGSIPYKEVEYKYINGEGKEVTEIIHQYSGLYVRAVCDVDNNGVSWTISNYYPIDIISEDINNIELSYPSYVQYNSAGTRPIYDNDEKFLKVNDIKQDVKLISLTDDLVEVNGINRFYPAKNYSAQSQRAGLVTFTFNNKTYYHSIIYYINQYSNEFVNSWGGNEIQIDENGQYLIAPQVGAGKKNEDNTFTGVLMGTLINAGDKQGTTDDGLFGFQNGEQTFRLGADGNAYFKGTIEAGSGKIGGWSIDEHGNLYSNGEVAGSARSTTLNAYGFIDTSYINATGGSIGGWNINGNSLTGGETTLHSTNGISTNKITINDLGTVGEQQYLTWTGTAMENAPMLGLVSDGKNSHGILVGGQKNWLYANKYLYLTLASDAKSLGQGVKDLGIFMSRNPEDSEEVGYICIGGGYNTNTRESPGFATKISLTGTNMALVASPDGKAGGRLKGYWRFGGTFTDPQSGTNYSTIEFEDNVIIKGLTPDKLTGWDTADLTINSLTTSGGVSAGSVSAGSLTLNNLPIADVITNTVNAMETLPTNFEDEVKTLAKGQFDTVDFDNAVNDTTLTVDSALQLDIIELINNSIEASGSGKWNDNWLIEVLNDVEWGLGSESSSSTIRDAQANIDALIKGIVLNTNDIPAGNISGALSNATIATSKLTGTLTSAHFADNTIATSRIINFDKEVDNKVTTMVNSLDWEIIVPTYSKWKTDWDANAIAACNGKVTAVFA